MNSLVAKMLQVDPSKRPTIHQLLNLPILKNRIQQFLQHDLFKEEFAHTLLHNQNVFDEFRKMQERKKKEEEDAKRRAE